MSGNSGGGGMPSINRPNENENCQDLVVNTNLSSPVSDVIEDLVSGNILTIQAVSDQGPLQALDEEGRLAGNIISREQVRLLTCILNGINYIAEVLTVNGGQCSVQIRAI